MNISLLQQQIMSGSSASLGKKENKKNALMVPESLLSIIMKSYPQVCCFKYGTLKQGSQI